MRDIVSINEDSALEPILSFFKKGQSHMAIITRVEEQEADKDPLIKTVGIVTLEDIMAQLIEKEETHKAIGGSDSFKAIKSSDDADNDDKKLELKDRQVLLFSSNIQT